MAPTIRQLQEQSDASFIPFASLDQQTADTPELVETFAHYQAEYAAIKKGVGILDMPSKGVIRLTGPDRQDFLHRLITNQVNQLKPGQSNRAFVLNKSGRIQADLIVIAQEKQILLYLDLSEAKATTQYLENYLFGEDIQITNISDQIRSISLHGPASAKLVATVFEKDPADLENLQNTTLNCQQEKIHLFRFDQTESTSLHLLIPNTIADHAYYAMAQALGGLTPQVQGGVKREIHGRGVGWLAFNTARIEAATPLYHIDFGADSLPAETGKTTFQQAVSLTKGCYLGQEIVARMFNLGHPKRVLVTLAFPDDKMPITGVPIYEKTDQGRGQEIGAITSSTLSPLQGNNARALAIVKWGKHQPDKTLCVPAEGSDTLATIQSNEKST